MEARETEDRAQPSVAGYLIALVGVAGWAIGCFLPLYRIPNFDERTVTLYSSYGSFGSRVGGLLFLFGGIAAIGAISILGARGHQTRTSSLLAGATVAWSLASIGTLISLFMDTSLVAPGTSVAVGYWCLWAGVICVMVGSAVERLSTQREVAVGRDPSFVGGTNPG